VNTPGSYQCDCYDGYQPVDVNATQCEGKIVLEQIANNMVL